MLSIRSPITSSAPSSSSRDEARDLVEVVGEVGVGHHDVVARARRRSRPGRRCRSRGAARATTRAPAARGELGAAVLGAVVGDDDLAGDAVLVEHARARGVTHSLDVLRLVEARDHDRHAAARRRSACRRERRASAASTVLIEQTLGAARRYWAFGQGRAGSRFGGRWPAWPVRSPPCASASSTTASSRTRSAAPSAGTATSPSGSPRTGHEVTYLTLRQWDRGRARRASPGVRVVAVGPRMELYARRAGGGSCRRSSSALGVLRHLLRHGRRYDVVHTASFPYFSLLAAALVRPLARLPARRRLARGLDAATTGASTSAASAGASAGACSGSALRVPQRAFCFSRLHAARLREEGLRGEVDRARGRVRRRRSSAPAPRAGRAGRRVRRPPHPREARRRRSCRRSRGARERFPELRGEIFGDGPERAARARARSRAHGLERRRRGAGLRRRASVVDARAARARSACVLPSRREGYGLVVVEAAAAGARASSWRGPTTRRPSSSRTA